MLPAAETVQMVLPAPALVALDQHRGGLQGPARGQTDPNLKREPPRPPPRPPRSRGEAYEM
eukprot:7478647-Lingulodinium_polyedra.AAC.1